MAVLVVGGLLVAACGLDWDRYDPRLGGGSAATGGATSMSTTGPGGATSTGFGGAGGAGGVGGTAPSCPLELALLGTIASTADMDVGSVDLATDGDVLVSGQYAGTVTFAGTSATASGTDLYVATLRPDGTEVALLATEDAGTQLFMDAALGPSGDLQGVGVFNGTMNLGPSAATSAGDYDVFWARDLAGTTPSLQSWGDVANQNGGFSIALGADGSTFFHGSVLDGTVAYGANATITVGASGYHLHAVRLDPAGVGQWLTPIGLVSFENRQPRIAQLDEGGDLYVGGTFNGALADLGLTATGNRDGFVARLGGADGQVAWTAQIHSPSEVNVTGLVQVGERLLVVGSFLGSLQVDDESLTSVGGFDGFVAVLGRSDGRLERLEAIASANSEGVNDIAVDAAGRIFIAGITDGDLELGCPLDGFGSDNLFVARLDETGVPVTGAVALGNYGPPYLDVRDGMVVVGVEFDGEIRVGDDEVIAGGTDEDVAVVRVLP